MSETTFERFIEDHIGPGFADTALDIRRIIDGKSIEVTLLTLWLKEIVEFDMCTVALNIRGILRMQYFEKVPEYVSPSFIMMKLIQPHIVVCERGEEDFDLFAFVHKLRNHFLQHRFVHRYWFYNYLWHFMKNPHSYRSLLAEKDSIFMYGLKNNVITANYYYYKRLMEDTPRWSYTFFPQYVDGRIIPEKTVDVDYDMPPAIDLSVEPIELKSFVTQHDVLTSPTLTPDVLYDISGEIQYVGSHESGCWYFHRVPSVELKELAPLKNGKTDDPMNMVD